MIISYALVASYGQNAFSSLDNLEKMVEKCLVV